MFILTKPNLGHPNVLETFNLKGLICFIGNEGGLCLPKGVIAAPLSTENLLLTLVNAEGEKYFIRSDYPSLKILCSIINVSIEGERVENTLELVRIEESVIMSIRTEPLVDLLVYLSNIGICLRENEKQGYILMMSLFDDSFLWFMSCEGIEYRILGSSDNLRKVCSELNIEYRERD